MLIIWCETRWLTKMIGCKLASGQQMCLTDCMKKHAAFDLNILEFQWNSNNGQWILIIHVIEYRGVYITSTEWCPVM